LCRQGRIEFLRQFRAELDAMLSRFGQYEEVAGAPSGAQSPGAAAPRSPSTPRRSSSTAASKRKLVVERTPPAKAAEPAARVASAASASSASSAAADPPDSIEGSPTRTSSLTSRTRTREEEDLRQLRLRHISKPKEDDA